MWFFNIYDFADVNTANFFEIMNHSCVMIALQSTKFYFFLIVGTFAGAIKNSFKNSR